ncbi:YdcH family protein [uncultured Sulfitobacter sp.]|uniref:YdcH family protein n=1 Tax=uncultured Sulfitobacter sp. TaxID=191468 RepID=UPI0026237592|nr:YdcH family protein [uncultured Sulfitobacter sp.]
MALTAHLEALKKKHRDMSEAIEAAQRSPATDALHLSDLKKQKMRLKEEITRLSE